MDKDSLLKIATVIRGGSLEIPAVGAIMCFNLYFLSHAFAYRSQFAGWEFYSILSAVQFVVFVLCLRICRFYEEKCASKALHTAARDLQKTMELNNEVLRMLKSTLDQSRPRADQLPTQ